MTNDERIAALVSEHTAEAERTRDDEYPPGTAFRRRSVRNAPVSIRLSEEERATLERIAAEHGMGVSTLAREMIVRGLAGDGDSTIPIDQVRVIVAEAIAPLRAEIEELRSAA